MSGDYILSKLIIFTGTLSHGGSERVISILSKALVKRFDQIEIILYHDKPIWYKLDESVKVTIIDKEINKKKNLINKLLWLRRYVMKNNTDLVISFLAPYNIFSILSLIGVNIPIIVAERNDPRYIPNKNYLRKLRNLLYKFSTSIVVQTLNNKQYFSKNLQKKIEVIYNPISLGDYSGLALRTIKEKKIVTVGRLINQKNQSMLIEAFSEVYKKFPEYRLVIYGEGDLRGKLNKQVEDLNLKDVVFLEGVKKDIHRLISDAELFVLTSEFEGMPNALIEAMSLGLPCISTKVSGAVDLIQSNKNGILIDKGNVNELVENIIKVIENKKFANSLGKNAIELNNTLDIRNIEHQWLELIIKNTK